MGITIIEQIGIVAGIVIGVSSFIYSVAQSRRQSKHEQELVAKEQERTVKEQERAAKEQERAAEQVLRDRLYFLANIIIDKDIPRRSRQIFFDEYVAKGGNGSFVKFWYDEEKELESKQAAMSKGNAGAPDSEKGD
jgi:hypothetical protein